MNKILFILIVFSNTIIYSQVNFEGNWTIKNIKTTHVLKGPIEEDVLPTGIVGKTILIKNDRIDISSIMKYIHDLYIDENHSAYFYIKEKHILNIIKDNPRNQFPGDELGDILGEKNNIKTSNVGTSFTNILKINATIKQLICYKIRGKNNFNTLCLLIKTSNPKELILFSYNDELLFFLNKI